MIRLKSLKEKFAPEMYKCGAFKDETQSPGRKGFKLHLHKANPQAPLSPFYVNMRVLRSFPHWAKATAVDLFQEMMDKYDGDAVADVPTGITPVISSLSDRTKFPMISPRAPKDHGDVGGIDGVCPKGSLVLLFDDVITRGDSMLNAVKVLRNNNLNVRHVFVLVDREEGGRAKLKANGLELHAAFTISELLKFYLETRTISQYTYNKIEAYRKGG